MGAAPEGEGAPRPRRPLAALGFGGAFLLAFFVFEPVAVFFMRPRLARELVVI